MNRKSTLAIFSIFILVMLAGCATPIGVSRARQEAVYRELTASALTNHELSPYSKQFLERLALDEQYRRNPAGALGSLHAGLGGLDEHDRLFALTELSYDHARRTNDRGRFMAAAVYAYAFLFPEDKRLGPSPFDPRVSMAMSFYNRSIADGLRTARGKRIDLASRAIELPFCTLDLSVDPAGMRYGGYKLINFVNAEDYTIRGLRNEYRKRGIGMALIAGIEPLPNHPANHWLRPRMKVPVTGLVAFEKPCAAFAGGRLAANLTLYDADLEPTVTIHDSVVPLESDPSAALAYNLQGSPLWDFEIAGFRRGDFTLFEKKDDRQLYFVAPYRQGRIPVVFVHGTASSPARWAQMFNELQGDRLIAEKYQFWFFIYNSGNPIAMSAMQLREALQNAVNEVDPHGNDPALRRMVVIGHSQGGLLTKMTAIASGDNFWKTLSNDPFDKATLSDETKAFLKKTMFIEPLPFVSRVVFISTPHKGSYVAGNLLGRIARRFITLPGDLNKIGMEILKLDLVEAARSTLRLPTAVDNMSWGNPFLRTLYELPISPDVKAHSIIAVKGKGPIDKGTDGVVRYESAHIAGVESEFVVRSGHSSQSNPSTIEEVRRILDEHANIQSLP